MNSSAVSTMSGSKETIRSTLSRSSARMSRRRASRSQWRAVAVAVAARDRLGEEADDGHAQVGEGAGRDDLGPEDDDRVRRERVERGAHPLGVALGAELDEARLQAAAVLVQRAGAEVRRLADEGQAQTAARRRRRIRRVGARVDDPRQGAKGTLPGHVGLGRACDARREPGAPRRARAALRAGRAARRARPRCGSISAAARASRRPTAWAPRRLARAVLVDASARGARAGRARARRDRRDDAPGRPRRPPRASPRSARPSASEQGGVVTCFQTLAHLESFVAVRRPAGRARRRAHRRPQRPQRRLLGDREPAITRRCGAPARSRSCAACCPASTS